MQNPNNHFIPVLTTHAGACLTWANWQELGIHKAAFYLQALLMKPGYSLLKSLSSLQSYCGWQGQIVLNATLPPANTQGLFSLRSPYDGSQLSLSQEELFLLLCKLKPDFLILPIGFASYLKEQQFALPKDLTAFVPLNEFLDPEAGVYLSYNKTRCFADFLSQLKLNASKATYLAGDFDFLQAEILIMQGAQWLESDKPASDALQGLVYGEEEELNLLNSDMANQHEPIMAHCSCPTCLQRLTRAYLHHILTKTPLLGQRYLIQHNVHYYQEKLGPYKLYLG